MFSAFNRILGLFAKNECIYLDNDGTVLAWTETIGKQKCISREKTTGKHYAELYRDSSLGADFFNDLLKKASEEGMASGSLQLHNKYGKRTRRSLVVACVKDEKKEIIGYTLVEK